jgi:hypothetical protein
MAEREVVIATLSDGTRVIHRFDLADLISKFHPEMEVNHE